jgi:pimeloyl-ACP methyl ester carboxylesterase
MVRDWVSALLELSVTGGDISHADAHLITCPVLIMLGSRDTLNPIPTAQQFIDRVKDGQLEVFEGFGHPLHTQAPERFRHLLMAHLERADALAQAGATSP